MNFSLTDEQRALQATVREFLADRFPLTEVRALYDDPDADADPAELWKAVGDQGWLAVTVPEQYDGLGLGLLDAAVIARCWGEGCAPGPLLPTLVAAELIRRGGSDAVQAAWLPRVAAGDAKLAVATGPLVELAHVADAIVVADAGGVRLVERGGFTAVPKATLDRSTSLSQLTVHDPGVTLSVTAADVREVGAVIYANDLAGLAAVGLAMTVDYVKTREQFGRPVGSFQALKHALADLHTATVMAGHAGWYAAHAVDTGLPDAALAVSVAKAKASDTAREVTAGMIQYHGGIGYTWEALPHVFFKRAKREEYQYGDAAEHRALIADLVV